MVRKKTEGNEEQRRAAARRVRSHGAAAPSAWKETTGASKQPGHLPRHEVHDRKVEAVHQGKQAWQPTEARHAGAADTDWTPSSGPGVPDYTEEHERVLNALAEAQDAHGGEGVYADDITRRAGLSRDLVGTLLHDLSAEHRLVTQLRGSDSPDLGPRFEVKPRL
jgi:hypothetical protein